MTREWAKEVYGNNRAEKITVTPYDYTVEVATGDIPEDGYVESKASLSPERALELSRELRTAASIVYARRLNGLMDSLPEEFKKTLREALVEADAFE